MCIRDRLQTVRCFEWVVTLLNITSKNADDIVENNNQVILPLLVGSNLILVVFLIRSMVKWIAICSLNSAIRFQILEKFGILKTSAFTFFENLEKHKII